MELSKVVILLFVIIGNLTAKRFPDSFQFGASGSAFQIEGAWNEDGKGPSIWDTFGHTGHIPSNDTGDVACDSYHKYKEDVQIFKSLNLTFFRFSISWARIMPNGTPNIINQAGIDHYVNLIKELKSNGIEPLLTIYHFDLPQYLSDMGGWLNPQIVDYFGEYARVVFMNFGPSVKYWLTINEPSVQCLTGYGMGVAAPGLKLIGDGIYQCAFNMIRAHARAYRIYDEEFRTEQGGKISIVTPATYHYPKNASNPLDVEAAERVSQLSYGMIANPIYLGNWPQIAIDRIATRSKLEGYPFSRLPEFTPEEIEYIKGTHDFFSLNYYSSSLVEHMDEVEIDSPSYWADVGALVTADPSWEVSPYEGLFFEPKGVRFMLNWLNDRYNPGEFVITENGWATDTGELDDQRRIDYLKGYLSNILDAILEDGIYVIGYTTWSFLDTMELVYGFKVKFGLVQVDFDSVNKTRTLKSSAYWYKNLASTREIKD